MPIGFLLLGMALAAVGAGCLAIVVETRTDVLARALAGSVALVSLVLVEALWWVRPWVARAVDAWAAVCVGVLLLPSLGAVAVGLLGFSELTFITLVASLFVGVPCAMVRGYVRDRAKRLGLAPGLAP